MLSMIIVIILTTWALTWFPISILGIDVIKMLSHVSAPTEEPKRSNKDVHIDKELDLDLEETLQFFA